MFEKYNEKARRALFFARYESSKLGSKVIESEHILLGVLREGEEIIREIFARFNVKPDEIRREIEGDRVFVERVSSTQELPLSEESKKILAYASHEAESMMHPYVGTEHLLIGILRVDPCVAGRILMAHGFNLYGVREETIALIKEREASKQKKELPFLAEYARDLTALAQQNAFDPLVGRDKEVERIIQILSRRTKNNPILLGEPGVGKTAIVEGLAQRIVEGGVPLFLAQRKILALDLSLIVAGTKYRGQFEERLKGILKELKENQDLIVFIDEIHSLIGAGSAEGSLDAANILKPALSRGEISCIGATTLKECRKYIEKDRSLLRRFQTISVAPPDEEETLRILEGVRERYETFHRVRYTADAIKTAVYQANRYIPDRFFPDKAIDILDEAGAKVKLRKTADTQNLRRLENEIKEEIERAKTSSLDDRAPVEVTRADVEEIISSWTGIPVTALQMEEAEKLLHMEESLKKRVIGQDRSLEAISRAIRRSRLGVKNPNRPMGSFIFLGPSGVGKTEAARQLAEFLFNNQKALVRFDMSEYMEKHSVSKLIGSPPGYVGYEEGGQLTERVKRAPYSVVLLDEIEKAHPDVFNILLQVFEDGQLTDGLGNTVDFKNTIIIMTSNIGARHLMKREGLGFQSSKDEMVSAKIEDLVRGEVKRTFNPEFLNRVDEIILFMALSETDLIQILELMVNQLNQNLAQRSITVTVADEAKKWILNQTLTDRNYGARPLRRAVQKYIEDPLSEALIQGTITTRPAFIEVFLEANKLYYRPVDAEKAEGVLLYES